MPKNSSRLQILIAGMKELFGEEEVQIMLSHPLTAEDVAQAASRHTLTELRSALVDARAAGASRWGWLAQRLRAPRGGRAAGR